MSWDSYIDKLLSHAGGYADKAAIISLDGGAPWTTAHNGLGLVFQGQEAVDIARVLKSGDFSLFQAGGIRVEGVTYMVLRADDDKTVLCIERDQGAVAIQSTKTAIVIAHTKEGHQAGNMNKAVALIAKELESLGM